MKFRGIAGMAFWIMLAVSISGIIGRYLYAQIPRNLNAAEISLKELQELQAQLSEHLVEQKLLSAGSLKRLLQLPSAEDVSGLSILSALLYIMAIDCVRPLRVARLRREALSWQERISTFGGLLPTRHTALERAIAAARNEAALSKRILFLSRSQQVFHLWHVVHKPFSYSFALLAMIHIGVVIMMGYF